MKRHRNLSHINLFQKIVTKLQPLLFFQPLVTLPILKQKQFGSPD